MPQSPASNSSAHRNACTAVTYITTSQATPLHQPSCDMPMKLRRRETPTNTLARSKAKASSDTLRSTQPLPQTQAAIQPYPNPPWPCFKLQSISYHIAEAKHSAPRVNMRTMYTAQASRPKYYVDMYSKTWPAAAADAAAVLSCRRRLQVELLQSSSRQPTALTCEACTHAAVVTG